MNKRLSILLMYFISIVSIFLLLVSVALYEILPFDVAIVLIILGVILFILGLVVVTCIDISCGCFQCKKCGHKFSPTVKEYIFGVHINTTRRLKCPSCGAKTWCKKEYDK